MSAHQVLTVAQMQAAEQVIFDTGITAQELMAVAAGGAAEWIRRIAAGRPVTVLCGPGNNGGDGYLIAEILRKIGNDVTVVAPMSPASDAAKSARKDFKGKTVSSGRDAQAEVFVDCLFGTGLTRKLSGEHALMLRDLAKRHSIQIAVDLPSGVESDSGAVLNERLPQYDVTLALGAWKFAHWRLPAHEIMGTLRLVPIGAEPAKDAAQLLARPSVSKPEANAHKYTRGMCAIIGGDMPGAALLASKAAMRSGAGYVKLFANDRDGAPAGLVVDPSPFKINRDDARIKAVLIGPGLGLHEGASKLLDYAFAQGCGLVLDADALRLVSGHLMDKGTQVLATPHDGELETLCKNFGVIATGRQARAQALAAASGMVVLAKGPDTVIAAPDGRLVLASPATSWLSVAGTGDVLAGIAVSRMATGADPFTAACEAAWLHCEAARLCGPAFTADELAQSVSAAMRSCL